MGKIHLTKGCGKLEGIYSINTSTINNDFCQGMAKTNTVCKNCYASRYEKLRPMLHKALTRNDGVFMDEGFIPEKIFHSIIRIHSFGEIINRVHFNNIMKLVFFNPQTHFSMWTKRVGIIREYLDEGWIIPKNLKLIYSNPKVDMEMDTIPDGFHSVFNVFTSSFIKGNGIGINCGGKSCKDCMLCYTFNDVTVINEKKK